DKAEIKLPPVSGQDIIRSWFVFVIQVEGISRQQRDRVIEALRRQGIGASAYFPSIHLQSFYSQRFGFKEGDFPICEKISHKALALPFFNNLTEDNVKLVSEKLNEVLEEIKK
ncbi:MAG: DegT/DnrJ/EryC1/StrS family aminotransferase, partial [Candidatus Margulisiibacteriota bacterium]